jgi:hypothetical protein
MRWNALFLLFVSFSCFGQEKADSIPPASTEPEWSTKNYTQEDKIYNRSVWTFADNPALAGFDRKLNVSYRYVAEKLGMGYRDYYDDKPHLYFERHHANIDAAFGGKNKNWGVGAAYSHVQNGSYDYHSVNWSHSYKIQLPKGHRLLIGHGVAFHFSRLDWNRLTFGDMIDPRYGFIWATNMIRPDTSRVVASLDFGLRYSWKRLSFDYVFQYGPNGLYAYLAYPDVHYIHRLKVLYHFYAGDEITITPEFIIQNNRVNVWRVNPIATVTYRDMFYGQLAFFDFNRMRLRVGYQFRDHFTIELGASAYTDRKLARIAGLASAEVGIRYQLSVLSILKK